MRLAEFIPGRADRPSGFTLLEVAVVVAILALVISITLPALHRARTSARGVQCMTHVREWGNATLIYAQEHQEDVPWDGPATDNPGDFVAGRQAYTESYFFLNAVPRILTGNDYRTVMEQALNSGEAKNVPLPGDNDIHICPTAMMPTSEDFPPDAPYEVNWTDPPLYFYFNYVINSKLERGSEGRWPNGDNKIRLHRIREPTATVLVFDMRSSASELPANLPVKGDNDLRRVHGKWSEMAYRHDAGTYVYFADGHVAHVDFRKANQPGPDSVDPQTTGYNQADLIWSPLTAAN
jgi:prepilin-type N-terminal cleavage/methylation domain-containing protein/prepilin-type processing-associated H-X9-DG protein